MENTSRMSRLRFLAVLPASALLLAGCAAAGTDDGSGTKLTVWHYFTEDTQVGVLTDYEESFEAAHEGVDVENVFVPYDQFSSKLIAGAGSSTGPDVVVFNGGEASTLALAGTLLPMDDYWGSFADADQFPEGVVHRVDDSVYMAQGYVNLLGLWYNQDILTEIGVEPPTTIDELTSAMAAAKDAGYEGITLSGLPQGQGEWQAYPWLSAGGFDWENLDTAALTEGYELVSSWIDNGYLSAESATWDQTVPFQRFAAGGVAFAENGNWQQGTAASTAEFEYGVVALPVGDEGKVYLGGEAEGIGAFSANPDLAWEYLSTTFFSAEGQLTSLEGSGTIPSRLDVAESEAVTSNPLLAGFAESVARNGANYPPSNALPEKVSDLQLVGGQIWSSVISKQLSPADAADKLVSDVAPFLK